MNRSLTQRERVLATIVGLVAFLFVTAFLVDYLLKNQTRLRGEVARNVGALNAMQRQLGEKPVWEQREAWLSAQQPTLGTEDRAGVELVDAITQLAGKKAVLIVNQSLRPPSYQPHYASISADIETTSTWGALIGFLQELQGPEKFVVLETANLKIDEKDATQMRGNFRVAKWFAPKNKPPK
ncbi:MAG TPA: hypothetical protein VF593_03645 [Chthoniobacteraceae bacterium]